MTIKVTITCAKCDKEEILILNNMADFNKVRTEFSKAWGSIDDLMLCLSCIKEWSKSFKKMKKENKKNFLKD